MGYPGKTSLYSRISLTAISIGLFALIVLAMLFASPFINKSNPIIGLVKSYNQFASIYLMEEKFRERNKTNGISSGPFSFTDNYSILHRITSENRIYDIYQPKIPNDNIRIPYIKLHKFWNKDPIKVFVDVNPMTFTQSIKYVVDVQKAISTWSNLLKIYSGKYNSWNFEIKNDSLTELAKPSIIIKVSSDPLGQICNDTHGGSRSYALTIYPQNLNTDAYIDIPTSCVFQGHEQELSHQEIYSTMLHEFGHALGLGHAYNNDGDLMCGTDGHTEVVIETCKPYSVQNARPSILDIKALIYAYGVDGFNKPNNELLEYFSVK